MQNVKEMPKEPHRLIQVGALSAQKRVALTIRAVAALKERFSDISLVLVGSGDKREELEMLCKELGIEERVAFLGQCPNAQVLEEMAKSQIFVMPSVNEGFGIVYLEAMASSCVTVGTKGEGICDLIEHGKNGCLVEPDNVQSITETVAFCIENAALTSTWAEQGRRDAMRLTWAYNAEQYVALFQEKRISVGADTASCN